MSGTAFIRTWPFAPKKNLTEKLATQLGWDGTGGEKKILELFESVDAMLLIKAEFGLLTPEEKFAEHILFPFTPVIEPYESANTFLSKDPILLGSQSWSNDIDLMIGGTSLEGGLMQVIEGDFAEAIKTSDALVPSHHLGWNTNDQSDRVKISVAGQKLQKFYFGDELPSPATLNQYFLVGNFELNFIILKD